MRYKSVITVVLLLIIWVTGISAAEQKLLFQQAAADLGAEPSCVGIQDSDGFLWFGSTANGLIRYDGYGVKKFKPGDNSVNNGWVNAIFEDSKGIIWIGTNGGGLNRYDKSDGSFRYFTNDPEDPHSISSNTFMMFAPLIIEDVKAPGVLWLGTQGGLNRFDTKTEKFTRYLSDSTSLNSLSHNEIHSLQQDSKGIIWIGTKNGLTRYDPQANEFTAFLHNPKDSTSLSDPEIWSILDDDSLLWVGTGKGELLAFDKETEKFSRKHSYGATVLGLDRLSGERFALSAGAAMNGLTIYHKRTGESVNYQLEDGNETSISQNGIRIVLEDNQGIIWVIQNNGVVDKSDRNALKFKGYRADPKNPKTIPNVTNIPRIEDKNGTIWMGSLDGLLSYSPETEEFSLFNHDPQDPKSLPHNYASSIFEDSEGTLWIGTFTGGVVTWDREREEVIKKVDISAVYKMIEDPVDSDILWCGTYLNGFVKYNKKTGEMVQYKNDPENSGSIAANIIVTMLQDRSDPNTLWIGFTGAGIDKYNKSEGTFTHYVSSDAPNSLPGNMVWSLVYDSEGTMWVGTEKGLAKFDPQTGNCVNFTEADGFPSNNCHFITEDGNKNLWIGTDAGIVVFDIATETVKKLYTSSDGIVGMPFFCTAFTKAKDGTFWVGGFKGLNTFHPDSLKENSYQPPVYLTSLTQGGEPIALKAALEKISEITLDWKHNYFEFEYAALNYTLPEKNQYQYMLEGWEDQWYNAGTNRKGRYSVIKPGSYTLRVRGSNNDGIWSDSEIALKVAVLTPPWKTSFAYTLYILILMLLIFAYLIYQQHQKQHLLDLVEERTREEKKAKERAEQERRSADRANAAKSDFLANMSHEIRTPMNAVMGFTEILKERLTESKNIEYLDIIETSGTALLNIINDILDLSKIESGKLDFNYAPLSIKELVTEMSTIFSQKMDTNGLEFQIYIDKEFPKAILLDETRIRQILINLIGNAIKFTDNGYVRISARSSDDNGSGRVDLTLTVEDSGIGIPEDQQNKVFGAFEQVKGQNSKMYGGTGLGLAISSRLTQMMGGGISVESTPGKGTTFIITIPDVELTREEALPAMTHFDSSEISFEPATILVADDIDYNREIISTFLTEWNFTILTAENGKEAVEIAEKHSPDLILIDMKMPVMDGYEASAKIRSMDSIKDIPIVAVTASTLKRDEARLEKVCNSYVRKPVSKAVLIKEIQKYLPCEIVNMDRSEWPEESGEMVIPLEEQLRELYRITEGGDMGSVKKYVIDLENSDSRYHAFAEKIIRFAHDFDDESIEDFLDSLMKSK